MSRDNSLRIGTRGSALALLQVALLESAFASVDASLEIETVKIQTTGDKNQNLEKQRQKPNDKRDWILEIERALVANEIDIALHSGKDVPVEIEPGTLLLPVLRREIPFDVFIADAEVSTFSDLPTGSTVGSSSARRRAQLLRLRPDLEVIPFGGNVPTRLQKLRESAEVDALVLARAGMRRLGLDAEVNYQFSSQELLPAVNQGILVAQIRETDKQRESFLHSFVDFSTYASFLAERACIEVLEADCNSAIGVFAEPRQGKLCLRAQVLSSGGEQVIEAQKIENLENATALGRFVAAQLLEGGARELL